MNSNLRNAELVKYVLKWHTINALCVTVHTQCYENLSDIEGNYTKR